MRVTKLLLAGSFVAMTAVAAQADDCEDNQTTDENGNCVALVLGGNDVDLPTLPKADGVPVTAMAFIAPVVGIAGAAAMGGGGGSASASTTTTTANR